MEKNYEFVEKEKPTERKGPQTLKYICGDI